MVAFLVLKGHVELLEQKHSNFSEQEQKLMVAQSIAAVLQPKSIGWFLLLPFVEKGGDTTTNEPKQYLHDFQSAHPGWENWDDAPTLFKQPDLFKRVELFVGFQSLMSNVCYIASAASMILYYMQLTTVTKGDEAIQRYGLNIGRFMRNNLTEERIFEMVFKGQGGYPGADILDRLLVLCHTAPNMGKIDTLTITGMKGAPPDWIFWSVHCKLSNRGALLVDDFPLFDEYLDAANTVFSGNWNDKKQSDDLKNRFRAFLIVGVKRTDDGGMGGVKFFLQDTFPERPFIEVGWDLLKSAGIDRLQAIAPRVTFEGTSMDHALDEVPSATWSGGISPGSRTTSFDLVRSDQRTGLNSLTTGELKFPKA
ncbi:expressed unknown protein [Seminavis robusta]|uniref:Uncharacterized protein n=1 Tax=Seminavis robusta TaxID=568900 RepID=A0A9N8ESY4_9STRA|nr:expressed unknown protein [Seminavis robusta]|eukprot:Sro1869_g302670.1 n/a (366) ;mRNA; f:18893-19990